MKYLFFDIECACVYKNVAKICAFGYVLTDDKFRVLERKDILLNPRGKFHLTDRKGKEGLVLPYEYEDFKKYPTFPSEYDTLKALLEDKDSIVCGHATLNDVNYLNLETKRYKLPSFKYEFYDTQFFYMNAEKEFSRQFGLQAVAEELGVEFTPHRAVDDAYATMRVCERLCEREGVNLQGLVEKYGVRAGKVAGYKIKNVTSVGQDQYYAEREEQRAAHIKAHEEFYRYVNKHMHRRKRGGSLEGKIFCFSRDIEDDVATSRKLLETIFASGGQYTSHPTECNVYISEDEDGARRSSAITAGAAFIPLETLKTALETV